MVSLTTDYFPLRQLTDQFYNENGHLERVLDKHKDSTEFFKKDRGYGIILVEAYGHQFGIPLRSNMTHKFCFPTEIKRNHETNRTHRKGLDYTKAVILKEGDYTERSFKIPSGEFDKINDSQHIIKRQFLNFISKYIKAVEQNDQNVLGKTYRDSTLINYHEELGIKVTIES